MSNFFISPLKHQSEHQESVLPVKTAVVSLSNGAGASLFCSLAAEYLSKQGSTALVECCRPYFYEALGFEKRFISRDFSAFGDKIRNGEQLKNFSNLEENINWWLRMPGDISDFSDAQLFRLLYAPKEKNVVFDCSGMADNVMFSFIAEADTAVVVVDPLPTALMASLGRLARIKAALPSAIILVNKMNPGVRRRELGQFLGIKDFMYIPYIAPETMYKSQYACRLPSYFFSKEEKLKTQDVLTGIFH